MRCVRWGSNDFSRCAYGGLIVRVWGKTYKFCLCVSSCGGFLGRCVSGPGFSSMSPCWRISVEMFHK